MVEKLKGLIGRLIIAVVVWIVVGILVYLFGGLVALMGVEPFVRIGNYIKDGAPLIGFLSALWYFVFGSKA